MILCVETILVYSSGFRSARQFQSLVLQENYKNDFQFLTTNKIIAKMPPPSRRASCIVISVSSLCLILTPLTVMFLNAEPGISSYYRRALSMSDTKDSKHPIVTLTSDSDKEENLEKQGLHSHDQKEPANSSNSGPTTLNTTQSHIAEPSNNPTSSESTTSHETSTPHTNASVSELMMQAALPTSDQRLLHDIHDASAQIIKDWGFGWDTKLSR